MKEITCYLTDDGKVCRTASEAKRHDALTKAYAAMTTLCESADGIAGSENRETAVQFIMDNRKKIFDILAELERTDVRS